MTRYIIKRVLFVLLTCFIVLSLTYILINCLEIPRLISTNEGEIAAFYRKQAELGFVLEFTSEQTQLGNPLRVVNTNSGTLYFYAKPVMDRYFNWLTGIITRWDWGVSTNYRMNTPTMAILLEGLPATVSINIISSLVSVPLGIGFGVICALKKNSTFDNISQVVIMALIAIPSFVLISYLILLAYSTDGALPPFWPKETDPLHYRVAGYVIPVAALSIGSIAGYARFVRAELCEVLSSEYLLLARTKGLTRGQAILRHAFRNSMVPVLPTVVAEFISILGGSMILENLYQIPGVGRLYIDAFNARDYNLLMTDMAFYTMIGLLASIVVDLSYGFIDPRIRMGAKK